MHELIYKDETYAIIGAAMEVQNQLGCGFLEPVYQEALEIELASRQIPFVSQQEFPIVYKGQVLQRKYISDLVIFDKIIVEIKALDRLSSLEEAQVLNYLKASGLQLGLLINFGTEKLEWKRMVLTKAYPQKKSV
jgi:GxxExxY protein